MYLDHVLQHNVVFRTEEEAILWLTDRVDRGVPGRLNWDHALHAKRCADASMLRKLDRSRYLADNEEQSVGLAVQHVTWEEPTNVPSTV